MLYREVIFLITHFFHNIHIIPNLTVLPKKGPHKKDFIIEKQLPHRIMKYTKCLSYPLPYYVTQIINPFLIQGSQPFMIKWGGLSANFEILIQRMFFYFSHFPLNQRIYILERRKTIENSNERYDLINSEKYIFMIKE